MTDKEQIIIDGIDVSKCPFLDEWEHCTLCKGFAETQNRHLLIEADLRCEEQPSELCYYKQRQRKAAECEELKEYIHEREVWGDHCEFYKHNDKENCHLNIILDNLKAINRYRKALEVIEKYCKEQNLKYDTTACIILDIINKAEGEGNG